jgi:hypothetical protein
VKTLRQWNQNLIHLLQEPPFESVHMAVCGIPIALDDEWVAVSEELHERFGAAPGRYCPDCLQIVQAEAEKQEQARTYRTRLVVIEALQYDGTAANRQAIDAQWPGEGEDGGSLFQGINDAVADETIWVRTKHGQAFAIAPGYWLIRGLPEEFWVENPRAFEERYVRYERVTKEASE